MSSTIDVLIPGGPNIAAWSPLSNAGGQFSLIDAGDFPAPAERINELVAESQGEFVAVITSRDADQLPNVLEQLRDRLSPSGNSGAAMSLRQDDDISRWIWAEFPAQTAALIQPLPAEHIVLFRRSTWTRVGPLRDVDEPLWDWLIRAAAFAPDAVIACPSAAPLPAARPALPALAPAEPGRQRDWLRAHIRNTASAGSPMLAGLLQLHDYLDESHSVSQSMEGDRLGDHWHGIMHRREPDYSNAKYWYRRVGRSPVFAELAQRADAVLAACQSSVAEAQRQKLGTPHDWDPFAFVDICQQQSRSATGDLAAAAREIQFWEMLLLLRSCDAE